MAKRKLTQAEQYYLDRITQFTEGVRLAVPSEVVARWRSMPEIRFTRRSGQWVCSVRVDPKLVDGLMALRDWCAEHELYLDASRGSYLFVYSPNWSGLDGLKAKPFRVQYQYPYPPHNWYTMYFARDLKTALKRETHYREKYHVGPCHRFTRVVEVKPFGETVHNLTAPEPETV
jgi:hypothetical protein